MVLKGPGVPVNRAGDCSMAVRSMDDCRMLWVSLDPELSLLALFAFLLAPLQ